MVCEPQKEPNGERKKNRVSQTNEQTNKHTKTIAQLEQLLSCCGLHVAIGVLLIGSVTSLAHR
eukprot:m.52995 g.52995  ORF g.52995 m.52995 type:complete len:63 (-) comp21685_c0_seq1:1896-2084(-)